LTPLPDPLVLADTLSADWVALAHNSDPDTIRFAAYHLYPLGGEGRLIGFRFTLNQPDVTAASIQSNIRFDENPGQTFTLELSWSQTEFQLYLPMMTRTFEN
jgi:hypothetical protein